MASSITKELLARLIEDLGSKGGLQVAPTTTPQALQAPPLLQNLIGSFGPTLEAPEEVVKLQRALAVISPDVPRGQGKLYEPGEMTPSKDYWLLVVWAIAGLKWRTGKEIARRWSMKSARFTEEGFEAAWNSYDPSKLNSIGIGSLYTLAKHHGWQPPAPPPSPVAANDAHYRLLSTSEILALRPIPWLIKGIFPATGLACLYGPSGSGKTFLAVDGASAISRGDDWFEHKTKQTTVVYVALEGEAGIRNRIAALQTAKGPLPEKDFLFLIAPFCITNPVHVAELVSVVPKGCVVFIDTLNRAAPTADENSSEDMGRIIEGAKALQRGIDGLVVLVHHTGKDTSKGLRGHSSLHAALDAAIEVERGSVQRSWKVAKSKDGEDGQEVLFKLEIQSLGTDADGDPITSCTVAPDISALFKKPEPQGKKQKTALEVIRRLLANGALNPSLSGCPPGTRHLPVEDVITALANTLVTTRSNKRTSEARRLVESLKSGGHLQGCLDPSGKGWCWE